VVEPRRELNAVSASPYQVLVVGPSWVGDMVMTQSLLITLQQHQPDIRIDLLAPAWCGALAARMPQVRELIDLPFGHGALQLGARRALGKQLAKKGYDQAILVPNSLKSAVVPFFARIPKRTGWRGEMRYGLLNDVRTLNKATHPTMLSRLVALGIAADAALPERMPWPRLSADAAAQQAARQQYGLTLARPVLGLCPGAEFGPSKRWPEQHYAALAAEAIQRGAAVWVFGSAKDRAIADAIAAGVPPSLRDHCHVLAGNTTLLEAVDLLAQTSAVVSNDSGLMHIAAATGRPVVALYGSSSPDFTPPLSSQAQIVKLDLSCSPCFERECPLRHQNCLVEMTPSSVMAALEPMLEGLH
jgi:heptosyltransferase-2